MVHRGRDGTDSSSVCVCSVPMVHRDGHMYVGTMGKSHQVLVSQWYTGMDSVPMVHRDGHMYVSTMGKTHQVLVFQWYTGDGTGRTAVLSIN